MVTAYLNLCETDTMITVYRTPAELRSNAVVVYVCVYVCMCVHSLLRYDMIN